MKRLPSCKEVDIMKWLILFGLLGTLAVMAARTAHAGELPKVGQAAPDFSLPDQNGVAHSLKDYAGKWLVLYFYPKDDTPGCTQEACAFRDDLNRLTQMGAQVVGISVDNSQSHAGFAKKYHLPFPLLADEKGAVASRYGALHNMLILKVAYRYTFLIDPQGKVRKVYDQVETSKHSREVIEDLAALLAQKL
jgi:peroxiredoxin Q/BCP